MERALYRTNPIGDLDGGWMCMECMRKHEPELHSNITQDDDYQVILDIESAIRD